MAIKIDFDMGFLKGLFSSKSPAKNVKTKPSASSPSFVSPSTNASKKSNEFAERLKREFSYYFDYVRREKSAKVILGLFSFLVVMSTVYFAFFSDAPAIVNILTIFFIVIFGAGAFFFELMLLSRRQFLVGVFIVDLYFFVFRMILKLLKKNPKKTPWLLEKFKLLLRINAPFFRRVTKEQYAKMSPKERESYMKRYSEYLSKLAKPR